MLVNLEEVVDRVNSPDNIINKLEIRNPYANSGGGGKSDVEKQSEAGAIAIASSIKIAAEVTGYSEAHIRDLKRGLTNHNSPPDEKLVKAIEVKTDKAQEAAVDKLMEALGLMDADKMSACDAKELSGIAANMAKVASMGRAAGNGASANVIIYMPQQRDLKDFAVIDV